MNCAYLKPNLEGTNTNRNSLYQDAGIYIHDEILVSALRCVALRYVALRCVVLGVWCVPCCVVCCAVLPCFALPCLVLWCRHQNLILQRTYQMEGGSTNPNRAVETQIQRSKVCKTSQDNNACFMCPQKGMRRDRYLALVDPWFFLIEFTL
jgi:hypothetical protein